MTYPNNVINNNSNLNKNRPTTRTLSANKSDVDFFNNQLSLSNKKNKVTISNSKELHEKLQHYANNPPRKEVHLQLKPGHYKMPSSNGVDKSFPVTNLKNISIEALDEKNKPRIERIALTNPENVHFKYIDFGVSNKKDWNHKDDRQTAIAINSGKNISIDHADISGMYDGINLKRTPNAPGSKGTIDFTLSNSNIHDLRRDAIISLDSKNTYILSNNFSSFHPNYENYIEENPKHLVTDKEGVGKLKPKKNVVYLTDKFQVLADHADIAQFANQGGDLIIKENIMSAKGGAWVQGIFIHNENTEKSRNVQRSAKIIIQDNIIQNNHTMGIAIQGQTNVHESNNTLSKIKTKGRRGIVTPKIDLNYERK